MSFYMFTSESRICLFRLLKVTTRLSVLCGFRQLYLTRRMKYISCDFGRLFDDSESKNVFIMAFGSYLTQKVERISCGF